jgi:hypothetical protein
MERKLMVTNQIRSGSPVLVVHLCCGNIKVCDGQIIDTGENHHGLLMVESEGPYSLFDPKDPLLLSVDEARALADPDRAIEHFRGRLGPPDSVLVADMLKQMSI